MKPLGPARTAGGLLSGPRRHRRPSTDSRQSRSTRGPGAEANLAEAGTAAAGWAAGENAAAESLAWEGLAAETS
eukprot:scaffold13274_cov32-Prasinocladus_malaysianus.AAC.1